MAAIDVNPLTVSFDWSTELDEVADRIAKRVGKSKDVFLRDLLLEALEDSEDYWIAHEAAEEFRRTGERSKPLEQVSRELGLDD